MFLLQKRLAQNVPKTLDNQREFDPSVLTADPRQARENADPTSQSIEGSNGSSAVPTGGVSMAPETSADIDSDPFASYFSEWDPNSPPKVLITTSPKATKVTYNFCEELVDVFPGAEFIRRKKGRGFEMGRIAGWAADRGYQKVLVVNEDVKKPSERFVICGVLISPCVSRRNHFSSSSERPNRVLQVDIDRTLKTHFREFIQGAVRRR